MESPLGRASRSHWRCAWPSLLLGRSAGDRHDADRHRGVSVSARRRDDHGRDPCRWDRERHRLSLRPAAAAFDNGTTSSSLDTLPADAALHTCDATTDAACAGYVRVQAGDTKQATGAVSLAFTAPTAGSGTTGGTTSGTTVAPPRATGTGVVGQVVLATSQYQVQGVRSSGYQETNQLTFQVLDTAGKPYTAGQAVSFSHQSLGGSYIGPTSNCTAAVPSICTASGVTDAAGKVTVLLTSGQEAGVVSVKATATGGASGVASNLAIIGAKSSGAHITLDCTPRNVAALTDNDCNFSHYTGAGNMVTCTASLADRFNNALGRVDARQLRQRGWLGRSAGGDAPV